MFSLAELTFFRDYMNTFATPQRHLPRENSACLSCTGSVEREKASVPSSLSNNVRLLGPVGGVIFWFDFATLN